MLLSLFWVFSKIFLTKAENHTLRPRKQSQVRSTPCYHSCTSFFLLISSPIFKHTNKSSFIIEWHLSSEVENIKSLQNLILGLWIQLKTTHHLFYFNELLKNRNKVCIFIFTLNRKVKKNEQFYSPKRKP